MSDPQTLKDTFTERCHGVGIDPARFEWLGSPKPEDTPGEGTLVLAASLGNLLDTVIFYNSWLQEAFMASPLSDGSLHVVKEFNRLQWSRWKRRARYCGSIWHHWDGFSGFSSPNEFRPLTIRWVRLSWQVIEAANLRKNRWYPFETLANSGHDRPLAGVGHGLPGWKALAMLAQHFEVTVTTVWPVATQGFTSALVIGGLILDQTDDDWTFMSRTAYGHPMYLATRDPLYLVRVMTGLDEHSSEVVIMDKVNRALIGPPPA